MKKHPTESQIISVLHSEASEETLSVREHISRCESCRERYAEIMKVTGPGENREIGPAPRVLKRIQASYAKIVIEEKPARRYRGPFGGIRFRPIIYGFATICAVILLSAFLVNYWQGSGDDSIKLALSNVSGSVVIDGTPVTGSRSIYPAMGLSIGKKSHAVIQYKDLCSISIMENSSFRVDSSIYNKKSMKYSFDFYLDRGKISGTFKKMPGRLEYTFVTPHARVESMGTSFTIEALDDATIVTMLQGRVRIRSRATGEVKVTSGKNRYIIAKSIQTVGILDAQPKERKISSGKDLPERIQREVKKSNGIPDERRIERKSIRKEMKRDFRDLKEGKRELRQDRRSLKRRGR